MEIEESEYELFREGPDGEEISYDPPRYERTYDFSVLLDVNSPWFSEMVIVVESDDVERFSPEYRQAEQTCEEIKEALTAVREGARNAVMEAARPKTAVQCPLCGATVILDENGKCEYCGGAIG